MGAEKRCLHPLSTSRTARLLVMSAMLGMEGLNAEARPDKYASTVRGDTGIPVRWLTRRQEYDTKDMRRASEGTGTEDSE